VKVKTFGQSDAHSETGVQLPQSGKLFAMHDIESHL